MNSENKASSVVRFVRFLKAVQVETSKIIWPKKNDVFSMTIFVLIMAFLSSLFFYVVDLCCLYMIGSIVG